MANQINSSVDEAKNIGGTVEDRETDWRVLRSLDAEVAERVMGWTRHSEQMHRTDNRTIDGILYCPPDYPNTSLGGLNCVPYYSTDIKAAMNVVDAFIASGGRVALRGGIPELVDEEIPKGHWQVNFFRFLKNVPPGTRFSFNVTAPTLPEAICRAALEAIEAKAR